MPLKLLSWNIWCGTHLDGVIDFLKKSNAGIIALQEACLDGRGNIAEIIAEQLGYRCVHAVDMNMPLKFLPGYTSDDKSKIKYGPALLSRYPIVSSKVHELSNANNFRRLVIAADINVQGSLLHVFSVHLKHTHQVESDLQNLEADNLLKLLPKTSTLVMGDFNALPDSTVIKKFSTAMCNTEIGKPTPTWSLYKEGCTVCQVEKVQYKLDYIFTSEDVKTSLFTVESTTSSDHMPISVVVT